MSAYPLTDRTILVAEDEADIAEAYRLFLEANGYAVKVAENGRIALREALTGNYDVMLLDLLMPYKNGFEILEELGRRGMTDRMPVIVISNLSQPADALRCKQLGAADYEVKSNISLDDLLKKVRKHARR
jgi:two-component system, OmpR family, response regulator ArlR